MKNFRYSRFLYALIPVVLVLSMQASDTPADPGCDRQLYRAIDSRLEPHIVGLLPKTSEPVVGFEVVQERPVVAFPHLLLGFKRNGVAELPVSQVLKGLSYAKNSDVLIQSDGGFFRLTKVGMEPTHQLNAVVQGRLYGSGSPVFVEVRARAGVLQFIARRSDGSVFPITAIRGPLRAASWNELGLAAVVADSLYLWQPGAKNVVRVLTDRVLTSAHDVVAIGNNRAVVALRATVAVVGTDTITIVAALPSARCRFQNGLLYVLQESNGLIWSFRGLETLGTKQRDRTFALNLLKQAQTSPTKAEVQFEEAARILGCKEAGMKSAHLDEKSSK